MTLNLHFRDAIQHLWERQVSTPQDYHWVKQIRTYYNLEQGTTEYLTTSVNYGYELVSMAYHTLLNIFMNEKAVIEFANQIILCATVPITTHSWLSDFSIANGRFYRQFRLSTGNESETLKNFLIGTWLTGAFLDVHLPQKINLDQTNVIAHALSLIHLATSSKDPYFKGWKNLSLYRDSGISLVTQSAIRPEIASKFKFDYRLISPLKLPWQPYLENLLEIKNIKGEQIGKRIGKVLSFLEESFGKILISRNQVRFIFDEIDYKERELEKLLAKEIMKEIMKRENMNESEKKYIKMLFRESFNLSERTENIQYTKSLK